ncbi:hypothetical protein F2Q70_00010619 [Brassica cretica]|uniref:Transposase-associated domain-containing protein n=1 Tax=Brassica cretica TaxID=69181 RepID=A0A8S9M9D9_BRACR|nr:hypothetical protein F2Q70_00010619 [Brassica cretica]
MSFYFDSREWMDQRIDPESNSVSEVFLGGINAFLQFACNQADYVERQTLLCLCARCANVKHHGEKFYTVGESSGANHSTAKRKCGRILLGMLMKITTRVIRKYQRTLRHHTYRNL